MDNPLLGQEPLPPFARIRPEHVEPGVRELLERSRAKIEELASVQRPTFANVVEPLEELQHRVSKVWSPVSHLNAVQNSDALRTGYNACLPLLSAYQTDLSQSEPLYLAYKTIAEQESDALGPVQRQVIEHALRDFRLAGVGLPAERKERFKNVMLELTQLQAKFEENVLDATNGWSYRVSDESELRGLNSTLIDQARRRGHEQRVEGWILTLDQPTYVAVVTDAESEKLRRAFYEAWSTRASDQGPNANQWDNSAVMEDILRLRHEAAQLLDFRNYAEYALSTRMAHSVDEVMQFLLELARTARDAALQEFARARGIRRAQAVGLGCGFLRRAAAARALFRLPGGDAAVLPPAACAATACLKSPRACLESGLPKSTDVPVWHPDVRFFEIQGADGRAVGSFYLDAYARSNKRSGAWMDECVGRKKLGLRLGAAGRLPGLQLPAAERRPPGAADPR